MARPSELEIEEALYQVKGALVERSGVGGVRDALGVLELAVKQRRQLPSQEAADLMRELAQLRAALDFIADGNATLVRDAMLYAKLTAVSGR